MAGGNLRAIRGKKPALESRRSGGCSTGVGFIFILLILAAAFSTSAGCIGMLKIANETSLKTPASPEERAALLQKLIEEAEEDEQAEAGSVVQPAVSMALTPTPHTQPDALGIRQEYVYGDLEHEMHATVTNVTSLPFYFWWFVDYNKFVVEQPTAGNQFLAVFVRFENTGTKTALVPSAEMLPVISGDSIYRHRPYFNTSVLSSFQEEMYGGANEFSKLPYQWIRELGQDERDYAFLTGYYAIGVNDDDDDNNDDDDDNNDDDDDNNDDDDDNNDDNSVTNTSTYSYAVMCEGSITLPSESGKVVTEDISDGQCPGYFIKPGMSNAIEGYLIYEVPENIDLKRTYLYGLFNRYSWTRWRLG